MRKKLINSDPMRLHSQEEWLDLEEIARVEVTSEDPNFPIEAALAEEKDRAGERPKRVSRSSASSLITRERCVGLDSSFQKQEIERTQEFTLRWSDEAAGPFREIVRQQWNFSPQCSTSEVEDYQVQLEKVSAVEMTLKPDLTPDTAFATLAACRVS